MAVFVPGMICPFCRKAISRSDDIIMFPPFVPNRRDPLYLFNDAVLHRACCEDHPLSKKATVCAEEARSHSRPGNRRCIVCNGDILDPDDYFSVGFLTDDSSSPAFAFNNLQLHRSHFLQWDRAAEFRQAVQQRQESEVWEGPKIIFDPMPRWDTSR